MDDDTRWDLKIGHLRLVRMSGDQAATLRSSLESPPVVHALAIDLCIAAGVRPSDVLLCVATLNDGYGPDTVYINGSRLAAARYCTFAARRILRRLQG